MINSDLTSWTNCALMIEKQTKAYLEYYNQGSGKLYVEKYKYCEKRQ